MNPQRKKIRNYFIDFKIKRFLALLLLTFLCLPIGIIPLVYYVVRYFLLKNNACTDQEFDQALDRDIQNLRQLLIQKNNIEEDEILKQFEIKALSYTPERLPGLSFFRKNLQIPFSLKKKGKDNKYRYTPLIFQLLLCLEDKLIVTITKVDFLTGNLLDTAVYNIYFNEITTYYFQDITQKSLVINSLLRWIRNLFGLKTEIEKGQGEDPNMIQGGIKEVNLARSFIIETRGGTDISLVLPDYFFIENIEDEGPHLSDVSSTIYAIQKLLDDKKVTI